MAYIYFPGCQYTAHSPHNSAKIADYLQRRHGAEVPGCCRVNHQLLAQGDISLCVCPTCQFNLEKTAPEAEVRSVWEVLAEDDDFPWPDFQGSAVTVQDCKDTWNNATMRLAVRRVLQRMNLSVTELPKPLAETAFCRPRTGEEKQAAKEHCQGIADSAVVCYCTGCLAGLKLGGAQGVHLMDLVADALGEVMQGK